MSWTWPNNTSFRLDSKIFQIVFSTDVRTFYMYSRRRGEISHTQKTWEATGGRDRFSDMIVLIVPATVFFPSSRFNRRPDFSTKNTATVNAEKK